MIQLLFNFFFFFFNDTATTEIYTLSLHDALPISFDPASSGAGPGTSGRPPGSSAPARSEEHTSELQSQSNLVCRLLLEKKKILKKQWLPFNPCLNIVSSPVQCVKSTRHRLILRSA